MADANGSLLTTPQLRYSRQEGKAVLRGPSTAKLVNSRQGQQKQTVDASWQELADLCATAPQTNVIFLVHAITPELNYHCRESGIAARREIWTKMLGVVAR